MHLLDHEHDVRPAEAVAELLDSAGSSVTSIVPSGYESYVRILNPIELRDGSVVSWTDAVARNGVEPQAWMQWPEFAASEGVALPDGDAEPRMGNPHPSLAIALIEALHVDQRVHYFATWAGYATEYPEPTAMFPPYRREMVLYSGPLIDEDGTPLVPTTVDGRVPMYWWPSDLQWVTGQDIYARSLIVGCPHRMAQRILDASDLDAYLISPLDTVLNEAY